jgi:MFS family permease
LDAHDHEAAELDGLGESGPEPGGPVPPARPVTFADVFGVREYRALWTAQLLSLVGDQLAIVALTWLVYERSGSAFYAAITYAIGYLPWLIGGPLLSGIADRLPRREVMVVCDLVRGVLMLAMATVGLPVWALCGLLFAGELLAPPFAAARAAVLPDVLEGDRYVVGTAIGNITNQLGQVVGFAIGGLIVGSLMPAIALALNAATFGVSAVLLAVGLHRRPAARPPDGRRTAFLSDARAGIRLVFGRRDLRTITGLAVICVFYVVPEGLVAPYAADLEGGPIASGLLLAAFPTGAVLGSAAFSRWVSPPTRFRVMGTLAIGSCAPLMLCALRPNLGWLLVIFTVASAASAYQLAANAAFVVAVPPQSRGQAFGLVQALMNVGQGGAIVLAGALAQLTSPTWVVTVSGAVGTLAAVLLARAWRSVIRPA